MKAIINGIEVIGTPEEIFEFKQLEAQSHVEALRALTKDFKPQVGITTQEAIDNALKAKAWRLI